MQWKSSLSKPLTHTHLNKHLHQSLITNRYHNLLFRFYFLFFIFVAFQVQKNVCLLFFQDSSFYFYCSEKKCPSHLALVNYEKLGVYIFPVWDQVEKTLKKNKSVLCLKEPLKPGSILGTQMSMSTSAEKEMIKEDKQDPQNSNIHSPLVSLKTWKSIINLSPHFNSVLS